MPKACSVDAEAERLDRQRRGVEDWYRWGPYLSERARGSVREDYSADGKCLGRLPA
jgi:hypothetical protein